MKATIKSYYRLTKPGIIYGNATTAAAGFLLASTVKNDFDAILFLSLLIGTSLVIAGACVINNYLDRPLDAKMARTKKRASVTGKIPLAHGLIFAITLGIIGFIVMALGTNWLTVGIGALGFFFYLVMYSIGKRRSTWGTVVGSVSGATPIVAGYTAVTNEIDSGAIILFLIMVFWQMPHFYSIAIYRLTDYKTAGLPVLPAVKGFKRTTLSIVAYIAAFTLTVASLTIAGYSGYTYLVVMVLAGIWWLKLGLEGFKAENEKAWGKQMFFRSLKIVMLLSVMTALGAVLP